VTANAGTAPVIWLFNRAVLGFALWVWLALAERLVILPRVFLIIVAVSVLIIVILVITLWNWSFFVAVAWIFRVVWVAALSLSDPLLLPINGLLWVVGQCLDLLLHYILSSSSTFF
jgi:hypothetical protein